MVLGIDVGGTKILAVDMEKERIHKRWKMDTVNGTVIESLKSIMLRGNERSVGIGVPCYLRDGICVKAPHISELDGRDLSRIFPNAVIMNDCTAMAYGEYFLRNEKYETLLLVALGTGIGTGLVFRGLPYVGRGSAMELGHIKRFSDKKCFCGKEGCLETVLGGKYINIKEIERKARNGDVESINYMKNYGRTLAKGLFYAIQLFDPEIVVIGGSVSNAYNLFIEPLKEELSMLLSFISVDDINFERALSPESGAIGAALITERELV